MMAKSAAKAPTPHNRNEAATKTGTSRGRRVASGTRRGSTANLAQALADRAEALIRENVLLKARVRDLKSWLKEVEMALGSDGTEAPPSVTKKAKPVPRRSRSTSPAGRPPGPRAGRPRRPVPVRPPVWIGLVEVEPKSAANPIWKEDFGDAAGAFTTAVAFADSAEKFREAVTSALSEGTRRPAVFEDVEPLESRRATEPVGEAIEGLVSELERSANPQFGTFYLFPGEEHESDAET